MGPSACRRAFEAIGAGPPGTTAAGTGKFEARSRPLPRRPRYRAVTSNPDAPRLEESQRGLRILQRRECTFSPKRCNRILRFVRSGSLSGACIAKRLADGILSAIDCVVKLEKKRSEEHTSELQSRLHLVCRLLLEKKKTKKQ